MKTCVDCGCRIRSSSPRCPACRAAYRLRYQQNYNAEHGCERQAREAAASVEARLDAALRAVRASGRYTLTPETIYAQSAVWQQQWADLADVPRGGSLERAESERRRK